MTDHKYTDEEVIRALECCCYKFYCKECSFYSSGGGGCITALEKAALDLIKRQRAEIEKWQLAYDCADSALRESSVTRSEAIKEFAENLKQDIKGHRLEMNLNGLKGTHRTDELTYETIIEYIDNLVKEMTEGKPCTDSADCSTCENCYHDGGYNECATDGVK